MPPSPAAVPLTSGGASAASALSRLAVALAGAAILAVILLYAGLVPHASWKTDEYETVRLFRDGGWPAVWTRILEWSPRPVSEALLYGYARAVLATGRPLVVPFLALLWAVTLAAALAPFAARRMENGTRAGGAILALALFALVLSAPETHEVFLWPQGSVAYMPTLAGLLLLFGIAGFSTGDPRAGLAAGGALLLMALSSEVGTVFAILFAPGALAARALLRWRAGEGVRPRAGDGALLVPLLAAGGVLALMVGGRVGAPSELMGDPAVARQLVPSLEAALDVMPRDAAGSAGAVSGAAGPVLSLLARALLFLAAGALALRGIGGTRGRNLALLAAFALAAVGASGGTLFGSLYQFGTPCCGRHELMREAFFVVAIAAAGLAAGGLARWRLPTLARRAPPLHAVLPVLALAVLLSHAFRVSALDWHYANYGLLLETHERNWRSGTAEGPAMVWHPTGGGLLGPIWTPPGAFARDGETPEPVRLILDFFGKERIEIRPPDPRLEK